MTATGARPVASRGPSGQPADWRKWTDHPMRVHVKWSPPSNSRGLWEGMSERSILPQGQTLQRRLLLLYSVEKQNTVLLS